ncbi:transposase [Betaproteobacteria bacterium]|nr:transposase [Betaproteobacteria bacterium]
MKYQCVTQLQQKAAGALSLDDATRDENSVRQNPGVASLCRLLEVSRSGDYAARSRAQAPKKVCLATAHLKAAFADSGRSYGSRRLRVALAHRGLRLSRDRVRKLMRLNQIQPVWKRKFIHTTESQHGLPVASNVLDRQFQPGAPNIAWVADITYIRTRSAWLYLAAVMDLYSRKIVGWAMAPNMEAELVCSALQMSIAQRQPPKKMIVHSDRESQYASALHRALLARHGLQASMSRKGNCWDNAVMERFFLNLKRERVWQRDYANPAEASRDITDYIVGFYNSSRLHSTLGYLPPNVYESLSAGKQPIHLSDIS